MTRWVWDMDFRLTYKGQEIRRYLGECAEGETEYNTQPMYVWNVKDTIYESLTQAEAAIDKWAAEIAKNGGR